MTTLTLYDNTYILSSIDVLASCLPSTIFLVPCRSNSILSRVIADVNITLTTLSDRVASLHDNALPDAVANATQHAAAATTAAMDDLSSTLAQVTN